MNEFTLVYPMLAMVLLSGGVLATLFRSRVRAVRGGQVTMGYFKIYQGQSEPESSAKAARHFSNLFEAPVLFYAACLAAMITHCAGPGIQALAWLYVSARVIHVFIHLGSNSVRLRMRAYFAGWLVLLVMWVWLGAAVAARS
jgi:hypothetical protein